MECNARRFVLAGIALALAGLSPAVGGQPSRRAPGNVSPDKGVFLVAKSKIDGGVFWQSVVLLLAHEEEGTLGLIINRVTEIPLEEVLPDVGEENEPSHVIHFGGPVGLNGLLFLFQSESPPEGASHVMDDVYYSGERDVLETLLEEKKNATEIRLFLGHAGWAPGQLDSEILRGSWDLVPADPVTVFHKDPKDIWPELTKDSRTIVAGAFGYGR